MTDGDPRRLRALLVSPTAKPGGAERSFLGLCRQLPRHGVDPTAVLLEDGPLVEHLRLVGCEAIVVPGGRFRQVSRTGATIMRLTQLLRRRSFSAVVSNLSKGHVYGGTAAAIARRPAILLQQDLPSGSVFDRLGARLPTRATVCISGAVAGAQARFQPPDRLVTIHLGVEVSEVANASGSGAAVRRRLGWDGMPIVGIVGRLQAWKGQDLFLRAAARVAKRCPDARFVVVGGAILGWEGSYPDDLVALASQLGLDGKVHFSGHVADVHAWMDMLDVVVHASSEEPFGLVVVEAMALGKPLIAAAEGGPLEIVEDGKSGFLVRRDVDDYAAAIERLLTDQPLAARLSEGARARAVTFSEERLGREFADLLFSVAGGAG